MAVALACDRDHEQANMFEVGNSYAAFDSGTSDGVSSVGRAYEFVTLVLKLSADCFSFTPHNNNVVSSK